MQPTYEGLKHVPIQTTNQNEIRLQPTYEGLKLGATLDEEKRLRRLQPTYEGLKLRNVKPANNSPEKFAAYL